MADRVMGSGSAIGIYYNRNFELLPYQRTDERPMERELKKQDIYSSDKEITVAIPTFGIHDILVNSWM